MQISFDINAIRAIITLASFVLFVAVVIWAYRPGNRNRFETVGRHILDDGSADSAARGRQQSASLDRSVR